MHWSDASSFFFKNHFAVLFCLYVGYVFIFLQVIRAHEKHVDGCRTWGFEGDSCQRFWCFHKPEGENDESYRLFYFMNRHIQRMSSSACEFQPIYKIQLYPCFNLTNWPFIYVYWMSLFSSIYKRWFQSWCEHHVWQKSFIFVGWSTFEDPDRDWS